MIERFLTHGQLTRSATVGGALGDVVVESPMAIDASICC